MSFWERNGSIVVDGNGNPISCGTCPCGGTVTTRYVCLVFYSVFSYPSEDGKQLHSAVSGIGGAQAYCVLSYPTPIFDGPRDLASAYSTIRTLMASARDLTYGEFVSGIGDTRRVYTSVPPDSADYYRTYDACIVLNATPFERETPEPSADPEEECCDGQHFPITVNASAAYGRLDAQYNYDSGIGSGNCCTHICYWRYASVPQSSVNYGLSFGTSGNRTYIDVRAGYFTELNDDISVEGQEHVEVTHSASSCTVRRSKSMYADMYNGEVSEHECTGSYFACSTIPVSAVAWGSGTAAFGAPVTVDLLPCASASIGASEAVSDEDITIMYQGREFDHYRTYLADERYACFEAFDLSGVNIRGCIGWPAAPEDPSAATQTLQILGTGAVPLFQTYTLTAFVDRSDPSWSTPPFYRWMYNEHMDGSTVRYLEWWFSATGNDLFRGIHSGHTAPLEPKAEISDALYRFIPVTMSTQGVFYDIRIMEDGAITAKSAPMDLSTPTPLSLGGITAAYWPADTITGSFPSFNITLTGATATGYSGLEVPTTTVQNVLEGYRFYATSPLDGHRRLFVYNNIGDYSAPVSMLHMSATMVNPPSANYSLYPGYYVDVTGSDMQLTGVSWSAFARNPSELTGLDFGAATASFPVCMLRKATGISGSAVMLDSQVTEGCYEERCPADTASMQYVLDEYYISAGDDFSMDLGTVRFTDLGVDIQCESSVTLADGCPCCGVHGNPYIPYVPCTESTFTPVGTISEQDYCGGIPHEPKSGISFCTDIANELQSVSFSAALLNELPEELR